MSELDYNTMLTGLRLQFEHDNVNGAVIELNGTKESEILAKLMIDVLGKDRVLGVIVSVTKNDNMQPVYDMIERLDITFTEVNIGNAYRAALESLLMYHTNELTDCAKDNFAVRLSYSILHLIAESKGADWRVVGSLTRDKKYSKYLANYCNGNDIEPFAEFVSDEVTQMF